MSELGNGLIAMGIAVLINAIGVFMGSMSSFRFKEAVKFSLPYIGTCFCGALSTFAFTLALNYIA